MIPKVSFKDLMWMLRTEIAKRRMDLIMGHPHETTWKNEIEKLENALVALEQN